MFLRRSSSAYSVVLLLGGCSFGLAAFDEGSPSSDDDGAADDDGSGDDDTTPGDDDTASADDDSNPADDDTTAGHDDGPDLDGDGYSPPEDCDDWNAAVHPGQVEVACDSDDNDCNGEYAPEDLDLDGDGRSPCLGDCDDGSAQTSPSAAELECDGIDQDCDGLDDCSGTGPPGGPPSGSICDGASYAGNAGAVDVIGSLSASDLTYSDGVGTYYYDAHEVQVPGAGAYDIILLSYDFDAWVEVYDATCTLVGYDNDSWDWFGTDALLSITATSVDTMYVITTSFYNLETGQYEFGVL